MRRYFDNENDDFDDFNDDFENRFNDFNKRMQTDAEFRDEMQRRLERDFAELARLLMLSRNKGTYKPWDTLGIPFDLRIVPLNPNFTIPEDQLNIEKGEDESGEWETKNWTSPDGSVSFSSYSRSSNVGDETNVPDEMAKKWEAKLRNQNTKRIKPEGKEVKLLRLQKALDYAVQNERYEKAAEIKAIMDELNQDEKEKGV